MHIYYVYHTSKWLTFRQFKTMPEHVKLTVAYHEAGHYILHRFADELINYKILAISIMPTENS